MRLASGLRNRSTPRAPTASHPTVWFDGEQVSPGAIGCLKTAGDLLGSHPHLHVLLSGGGRLPDGTLRHLLAIGAGDYRDEEYERVERTAEEPAHPPNQSSSAWRTCVRISSSAPPKRPEAMAGCARDGGDLGAGSHQFHVTSEQLHFGDLALVGAEAWSLPATAFFTLFEVGGRWRIALEALAFAAGGRRESRSTPHAAEASPVSAVRSRAALLDPHPFCRRRRGLDARAGVRGDERMQLSKACGGDDIPGRSLPSFGGNRH